MAHDWRAPLRLQGLSAGQRLRSPPHLIRLQHACRLPIEPAFQLADRDETPTTAPHNPQLGHHMLIEEVAADSKASCGFVR
jgi:hypothetical protein